jgi:hypothetical protein
MYFATLSLFLSLQRNFRSNLRTSKEARMPSKATIEKPRRKAAPKMTTKRKKAMKSKKSDDLGAPAPEELKKFSAQPEKKRRPADTKNSATKVAKTKSVAGMKTAAKRAANTRHSHIH